MDELPPLVLGDFRYTPQDKPNLVVLPSGDVMEFGSLELAVLYLEMGRRAEAPGAEQSAVFFLQDGKWVRHE
jgi:hypothetical protein